MRAPRSNNSEVRLCQFPDITPHVQTFIDNMVGTDFALTYLKREYLSKHPSLEKGVGNVERRERAIAKLLSSDLRCLRINEEGYIMKNISSWDLNGILKTAQTLIANLLEDWEANWYNTAMFSNGASFEHKLQDAAPYQKIAGKSAVTRTALPFAIAAVKAVPQWEELLREMHGGETEWFSVVPGNSVFTVPKNSGIDRAAAKEPSLNMYLQKSIGTYIRGRLKRVGIDLNDQSVNQKLAHRASIDGSLATLDLSAASDSISERIVFDLLPPRLFKLLYALRSPIAVMDGKMHIWSLFSTMGNGFTFELESLLFWSLSKATLLHFRIDGELSIYGDDIIIPNSSFGHVVRTLNAVGFVVNESKSFDTGLFRESCGGHYYNGIDVKPFYIRQPITDVTRIILLMNRIRGWQTIGGICDPRMEPLWLYLKDRVISLGFSRLLGGKDLNSPYSVCDPTQPRDVLIPSTRKKVLNGAREYGRYIHSLHINAQVLADSVIEGSFRIRKNRSWWTEVPVFHSEC